MKEIKLTEQNQSTELVDKSIFDRDALRIGNEVAFIRRSLELPKIRECHRSPHFKIMADRVIQEAFLGLGIKTPLNSVQKADIQEIILSDFKSLSLTEVAYALKMERKASLGDPIEHYGQLTGQYIGKVLNKYREYKKQVMINNSIPMVEYYAEPEYNVQERRAMCDNGTIRAFEHYQKEGEFPEVGYTWVYDHLVDLGLITPSVKTKNVAMRRARIRLQKTAPTRKKHRDEFLKQLEEKSNGQVINIAKQILATDYFKTVIDSGLDFAEELTKIKKL